MVYTLTKATVNRYNLHKSPSISYIRVIISVVCITGVAYIVSGIFLAISAVYGYLWATDVFTAFGTAQGFLVSIVFLLKRRTFKLYKARFVSLLHKWNISAAGIRDSKDSNMLAKNGTVVSNGKISNKNNIISNGLQLDPHTHRGVT